ncbi:MAG: BatD family protein [Candidatus Omnitrophica bacterium]|nr:BatD family protein [Candidatus Omnitrophota bacterium]MDD5653820.1 BatD family protein [Candidatus Omnitrophota bacterium]
MKSKFLLTIILAFLIAQPALAEVAIKAEVNKLKLSTDETLLYKVVIASVEPNLAQPQLPKFTGFNIISQSQATSMALEKNGWKTSLIYEFLLSPASVGKLKIEPASIKVKNESISSEAFEIEVTQGKTVPQAPEENPLSPKNALPESQEPKVTL